MLNPYILAILGENVRTLLLVPLMLKIVAPEP